MILADICHEKTALSDPQIQLLGQLLQFLPFVRSTSQQEIVVFTETRDGNMLILGHECSSEVRRMDFPIYTVLDSIEVQLWVDLFRSGKAIKGKHERDWGYFSDMAVFPIVDSGGKTIGGVSFIDDHPSRYTYLLAETAFMAMIVPNRSKPELYQPLSYQDGLIIFDDAGIILYANEAASNLVNLLGFDRRLHGTSIYGGSLKLSFVKEALSTHKGDIIEDVYHDMILEQHIIPLISGGKTRRSYFIIKDKTLLRKSEQQLLVKNSVIKEIHHRVKNNMQAVAGLLRMQARRADTPAIRDALLESINRIDSMALVHDIVSHYDADYIDLRTISEELIRLLSLSMLSSEYAIRCNYIGDSVILPSDQASYISLILNELLSNSFAHGFSDVKEGLITVEGYEQGASILLRVTDTGIGFPHGFDPMTSKRLGLQIIRTLVEGQLNGTLEMVPHEPHGVRTTIVFAKEV